jgi:hypothetical protein
MKVLLGTLLALACIHSHAQENSNIQRECGVIEDHGSFLTLDDQQRSDDPGANPAIVPQTQLSGSTNKLRSMAATCLCLDGSLSYGTGSVFTLISGVNAPTSDQAKASCSRCADTTQKFSFPDPGFCGLVGCVLNDDGTYSPGQVCN